MTYNPTNTIWIVPFNVSGDFGEMLKYEIVDNGMEIPEDHADMFTLNHNVREDGKDVFTLGFMEG